MKAAIYARKSKYSASSESIENQLKLCRKLALELGIDENNIYEYKDDGISGATDERPGYKMLINDITHAPNGFTHLICYKIDRLSRRVYDFAELLVKIKQNNIQLKSYSDSFDANTISGEAMLYILSVFSQLERELITSRIKDNMYELARQGRWLGGRYPFGFIGNKIPIYDSSYNKGYIYSLTIDNSKVDIVKSIFDKYLELKSVRAVTSYAFKNNILSSIGNHIQDTALRKILRNPVYVKSSSDVNNYLEKKGFEVIGCSDNEHGYLTYSKRDKNFSSQVFDESDVEMDSHVQTNIALAAVAKHKGIVDSDVWLKVQNLLDENLTSTAPRAGTGTFGILSGLIKCSECGSTLNITYSIKTLKDGTQRKYYYYTCSKKVHVDSKACKSTSVSGYKIDKLVIDKICNLHPDDIIRYYNRYKHELLTDNTYIQTKISIIKESINNKEQEQKRLIHNLALITDDSIIPLISNSIASYTSEITKLKSELNTLLNDTFKLDSESLMISNAVDHFKNFNSYFNQSNIYSQRNLIRALIDKAVWNHNSQSITIYYKDNYLAT